MKCRLWRPGVRCAVVLLALAGCTGQPTGPGITHPAAAAPIAETVSPFAGTASCSAAGCHGRLAPASDPKEGNLVLQDEFHRWIGRDPHSRAYAVLFEERSKRMAQVFGDRPAWEQNRCLVCHTTPWTVAAPAGPAARERAFGVGCESCHGDAGRWLVPHTVPGWAKTPEGKKAAGMVAVEDPWQRFQACATCHVGAPPTGEGIPREVTHDLIAAGHPRLQFEASAFLANLPIHWNPQAKRDTSPTQAWALGQLASATASVDLLTAHPSELAHFDCYACHHDLGEGIDKKWRQRHGHLGKRRPGTLPWNTWYVCIPREVLASKEQVGSFDDLEQAMTGSFPPPAELVAARARKLAGTLADLHSQFTKQPLTAGRLRERIQGSLSGDASLPVRLGWDGAEQLFLAAPLVLPDGARPVAERRALLESRRFPQGFDSPRNFDPDRFLRELRSALDSQ